jgi:putative membrane protein
LAYGLPKKFNHKKMKFMKKWMLAASVCAVVFTACDKDDDDKNVNNADRDFVMMTSLSNNAEVMAGQVAATKGTSAMVKMYGQQMVSEHSTAQTDLRSRASAVGLSAPDTIDAEHKAKMMYLNSLNGYSFDTAYINSQVVDHAKTLTIFNMEISNGSNESIRSYATNNVGHIQMHFTKADSIRRAL